MIKIENLLTNVNEVKRERIINSALKEFSENTFEKASTNAIVKDADVSKGTLFHYFGSKEKLYNYLEYFSIHVTSEAIVNAINWNQSDIFLRLKDVIMIKFKVFLQYPYLADFSLIAFEGKSIEDIMEIDPTYPIELQSQVYTRNIDYSLFKEDIDMSRAIDIIRWTLEKYTDELRLSLAKSEKEVDLKKIEKEIFVYIEMLKKAFYK